MCAKYPAVWQWSAVQRRNHPPVSGKMGGHVEAFITTLPTWQRASRCDSEENQTPVGQNRRRREIRRIQHGTYGNAQLSDGRWDFPSPTRIWMKNRHNIPTHRSQLDAVWSRTMHKADLQMLANKGKARRYYNASSRGLDLLKTGDIVLVQDEKSRRWNTAAKVLEKGKNRRYWLRFPCGRLRGETEGSSASGQRPVTSKRAMDGRSGFRSTTHSSNQFIFRIPSMNWKEMEMIWSGRRRLAMSPTCLGCTPTLTIPYTRPVSPPV